RSDNAAFRGTGAAERRGDEETRKRGNEERGKGRWEDKRRGGRSDGDRLGGHGWLLVRRVRRGGAAVGPHRITAGDYAYEGESDCGSYEVFIRSARQTGMNAGRLGLSL